MQTRERSAGTAKGFYDSQRSKLLPEKSVTEKTMFGTTALCIGGKVFMFPWRETLVLKLPAESVERLVAPKREGVASVR